MRDVRIRWGGLLLALVALLATTGGGLAEVTSSWGILSASDAGTPAVLSSDLVVFRRVLGLSDEEFGALRALHDAYAHRLASEGREVRRYCTAIVEEAQIKHDSGLLEPAQKRVQEWRERKEALDKQFLDDVRVLLTAEQEQRWPLVEREMRRLKQMGRGRLHGESVDLIRLADAQGIDVDGTPRVADILDRYSRDLDRALVRRDQRLDEANSSGYYDLIDTDPAQARAIYERCLEARRDVRDVNRRYVRELAGALDDHAAARLRRRFFELSFPYLVRPTVAERCAEAAAALPGLSDAQKQRLTALRKAYEPDRDAILEKQGAILLERELLTPGAIAKEGEPAGKPQNPGVPLPEDDPLQRLRVQRWELDKAYREKVESVLTDRQRESLPSFAEHATFVAPGGGYNARL